jgi:hypothetical protein
MNVASATEGCTMPQQTALRTMPAPGRPGAPDLVTHLLRDHDLGFFSTPSVHATRADGMYDLCELQDDHWYQHAGGTADHEHADRRLRS